jgi:hypothetical protein
MPHNLRRSFPPHQQRKSINKDRLARSSLAREQVQPRAKHSNGMVDYSVVFSAKFDEHES